MPKKAKNGPTTIMSVRIAKRLLRRADEFTRRQPVELSVSKLVSLALTEYLRRRRVAWR